MMDRRTFIAGVASSLLTPLAAEAQQARKVPVIGLLSSTLPTRGFREGLYDLGYVEGRNVAIYERLTPGDSTRLAEHAAELVRLKVDTIVASNNPAIEAARNATATIPIVMVIATDPVRSGFVASLARPGGNITGLTTQYPELAGKRLELLKEAIPTLSRLAVLWDPSLTGVRQVISETEVAAKALGMNLQFLEAQSPSQLDSAFAAMVRGGAGAVLVQGSDPLYFHRTRIAEHAVKSRLPAMCPLREYVEAGCLISYWPSLTDHWRRAAYYVDRILKGAKPADLPIEQPTKFELVINLKTAKALGLTIPQTLLLRADQVIE